jgi:hypothetical protein
MTRWLSALLGAAALAASVAVVPATAAAGDGRRQESHVERAVSLEALVEAAQPVLPQAKNTYHVFDAAMPFGGYKESGWGREMGHQVLENYLETKSVITRLG